MMELAHIGRALFDEMAAGGNVLRGLAMEFGRLQIAVSAGEGGITGMLGRVAGFAGKLANPLALATGSALALGAASVYGFSRYEEGQESLERALNTRGRYSGLTMDTANRLAGSNAATGGFGSYGPQLPNAGGGILSTLIAMLPHFAGGTADAPGGPTVVGEDGPEVVEMPQHAQVASNGQAQGWMQGRGGGSNTFHIGGPTIMVQGDVSEQNRAEIQRAVAAGQQQTVNQITRNLSQLQSDSRQHN